MFKLPLKKSHSLAQLISSFYKKEGHGWIQNDRFIHSAFEEMFSLMPLEDTERLILDCDINFVSVNAEYACSVGRGANCILLFPNMIKVLKSPAKSSALAILAHEIGHILYAHHDKKMDVLKAQVEADSYALKLGLAEELENFLIQLPESIEKRLRLTFLTSYVVKNH